MKALPILLNNKRNLHQQRFAITLVDATHTSGMLYKTLCLLRRYAQFVEIPQNIVQHRDYTNYNRILRLKISFSCQQTSTQTNPSIKSLRRRGDQLCAQRIVNSMKLGLISMLRMIRENHSSPTWRIVKMSKSTGGSVLRAN